MDDDMDMENDDMDMDMDMEEESSPVVEDNKEDPGSRPVSAKSTLSSAASRPTTSASRYNSEVDT